jgi:hypothetical protein
MTMRNQNKMILAIIRFSALIALLIGIAHCKTTSSGSSVAQSRGPNVASDVHDPALNVLKTTKLMAIYMPNEGVTFFHINLLNEPIPNSDNALAFAECKPNCVSDRPAFTFIPNSLGKPDKAILELDTVQKRFSCVYKTYETGAGAFTCHE